MRRQGRILLVDDDERWLNEISSILQRSGFYVDTVATISQAIQKLDETFYHLAILDIRMEDNDQNNAEGMTLLNKLDESNLLGAIEIIMLSAYGTMKQMREAFAHHRVVDFLSKEDFDNLEFLEQVARVFADKVLINLNLDIHWQQVSGPEPIVTNLELAGVRIKRDKPLLSRIAVELDDLLCRLFHKADGLLVKPLTFGHSGAVVLLATPFYKDGAGQPVVVKFGDFHNIDLEYRNFKHYVQNFIGGARSTNVIELRRTPRLGGIVYSLLGSASERLESFGSFYSHADISQIKDLLNRLFHETCGPWYANPGRLQLHDLTNEYQQLLGFNQENLEQALSQGLKSVQGKHKLHFNSLDGERTFTNPIMATADQRFVKPIYICSTHGDLNENNVLVDGTGNAWLIDFYSTGPGHILRDAAKLDSVVRFQLLSSEDATLNERLILEQALCNVDRFSQVERLAYDFHTENTALAKAYAVVVHLRTLAYSLVSQNPNDDIGEYYIALLYYAINTTRFYSLPTLQRQHALLSASMLADRIGL